MHPEIDNPDYQPDDELYKFADNSYVGFEIWQVFATDGLICLRLVIIFHNTCEYFYEFVILSQ